MRYVQLKQELSLNVSYVNIKDKCYTIPPPSTPTPPPPIVVILKYCFTKTFNIAGTTSNGRIWSLLPQGENLKMNVAGFINNKWKDMGGNQCHSCRLSFSGNIWHTNKRSDKLARFPSCCSRVCLCDTLFSYKVLVKIFQFSRRNPFSGGWDGGGGDKVVTYEEALFQLFL